MCGGGGVCVGRCMCGGGRYMCEGGVYVWGGGVCVGWVCWRCMCGVEYIG